MSHSLLRRQPGQLMHGHDTSIHLSTTYLTDLFMKDVLYCSVNGVGIKFRPNRSTKLTRDKSIAMKKEGDRRRPLEKIHVENQVLSMPINAY